MVTNTTPAALWACIVSLKAWQLLLGYVYYYSLLCHDCYGSEPNFGPQLIFIFLFFFFNITTFLTCSPSMLLHVRVQGHAVQFNRIGSPRRILDAHCGTQSANLRAKYSHHNTPTHDALPLWSKSIPLITDKNKRLFRGCQTWLWQGFPIQFLLHIATLSTTPGQIYLRYFDG